MNLTSWLCLATGLFAGIVIGERLGFYTLRKAVTHFVDQAYRLAAVQDDDDDDGEWWKRGQSPPGT